MSNSLFKEFRPLLLPACVAIIGSAVRPSNDLAAMVGSLACYGGFALLAAMVFGLEFQQRTLSLLLSQPVERSSLWRAKLLVVVLAGVVVTLINWQVQELISNLPPLLLLLVWMGLLATVCSSGFWIQTTGSIFAGLVLSIVNQLLVFGGLGLAIDNRQGFTISFPNTEVLLAIFFATLLYSATFLWLGRRFWTGTFVTIGTAALIFLMLCGLSQVLSNVFGGWTSNPAETCLSAIFLLATACSVGFWTLIASTTIGGAVLSTTSEFLTGLICLLVWSRIYREDPDIHQPRFMGPLVIVSLLYCGLFVWLGWRKFARLEVRDSAGGENLLPSIGFLQRMEWSPNCLRCRPRQNLLNLIRKEFRLQKPLLMLACVFAVCWLATYALELLQLDKTYANLKDILTCFYVAATLLLAGCMSLGDEKVLGLTTWQLALPISVRTQWFIKLVVAAITGATLGFLLPLLLYFIAAIASGTWLLTESGPDAAKAIAMVSGSLFILGFWASTLLTNAVRAALSAVAVLIVLPFCLFVGGWLAEHFESLRIAFFPAVSWIIIPLSNASHTLKPSHTAILMGSAIAVALILFQSFQQFRRIQIPTATLVKVPLSLACVCLVLGSLVITADDFVSDGFIKPVGSNVINFSPPR
jgi:hypothetical protein